MSGARAAHRAIRLVSVGGLGAVGAILGWGYTLPARRWPIAHLELEVAEPAEPERGIVIREDGLVDVVALAKNQACNPWESNVSHLLNTHGLCVARAAIPVGEPVRAEGC